MACVCPHMGVARQSPSRDYMRSKMLIIQHFLVKLRTFLKLVGEPGLEAVMRKNERWDFQHFTHIITTITPILRGRFFRFRKQSLWVEFVGMLTTFSPASFLLSKSEVITSNLWNPHFLRGIRGNTSSLYCNIRVHAGCNISGNAAISAFHIYNCDALFANCSNCYQSTHRK